MHLQAYLRSAEVILQAYNGEIPFAAWLKNYFRQHKKFGSRDRRYVADLCFCFYRLGKAFGLLSIEERLLTGQFLCHQESPFIRELKPDWNRLMTAPLSEKLSFLAVHPSPFALVDELSEEIEVEPFQLSFLQQPDLFLRIRPGREKVVIRKLSEAAISFQQQGACLRLANNTNIDEVLCIDEEVVVQDISSQQVLTPLQQYQLPNNTSPIYSWDCCAASGGKSILLHDLFAGVKLTVSDIRESILANLRSRLKRAGIPVFHSFVADVASPQFSLSQKFNIIICDAPCSGSGTWGRTPEQLQFFPKEKIEHYVRLQKSIALNASRSLHQGSFFLYITCSVFFRENEGVVQHVLQNSKLALLSQQYVKGYHKKGDTLFTALFTV